MPLRLAVGDHNREAITLSAMADAHADLGHVAQAIALHEQALALRRAAGDRRNEALGLESLSRVVRREPARALDLAQQALALYRQLDDRQGIAAALADVARAERDQGRLDDARAHAFESLDAAEQVRAPVGAAELRSQSVARQHDVYLLTIDILARLDGEHPGAGYAARALEVSERARARSLLELLTSAGARITHGGDAALVDRERRLAVDINAKGDRLLRSGTPAAERDAITRELRALEAEYDDVRAEIRRASPGFASLTDAHPMSVADIQQH